VLRERKVGGCIYTTVAQNDTTVGSNRRTVTFNSCVVQKQFNFVFSNVSPVTLKTGKGILIKLIVTIQAPLRGYVFFHGEPRRKEHGEPRRRREIR
jgi:hypothetical protein